MSAVEPYEDEPLELERCAARENREHDAQAGPALALPEPGEVGALHLRRVAGRPAPPAGTARLGRADAEVPSQRLGVPLQQRDQQTVDHPVGLVPVVGDPGPHR